MKARSRSHGNGRQHFYGCAWYHERGRTVCANNADVPMTDADDIVIEALLDDVLDETMILEAVEVALEILKGADHGDRLEATAAELVQVEQERDRLVAAMQQEAS